MKELIAKIKMFLAALTIQIRVALLNWYVDSWLEFYVKVKKHPLGSALLKIIYFVGTVIITAFLSGLIDRFFSGA